MKFGCQYFAKSSIEKSRLKPQKQVSGGALLVAVSIAFLIALICSFLILLSYHYKIQAHDAFQVQKLTLNLQSGLNLALSEKKVPDGKSRVIDLYGQQDDSVLIKKQMWGAYEVASVKSFSGYHHFIKTIMYGYKEQNAFAFYMADTGSPLSMCGNVTINGNCYLPEAGVRKAYLEGVETDGMYTIKGKELKSNDSLPLLNKEHIQQIVSWLSFKKLQGCDYLSYIPDSTNRSFLLPTLVIRNRGTLILRNKKVSGNVIVQADSMIVIERSTVLDNVILVAPRIIFQNHVRANVQVYASDSIILQNHVRLEYPSVLGVIKGDSIQTQPFIHVHPSAYMHGLIFSKCLSTRNDLVQTKVTIGDGATVKGQVYIDGFADLHGEVTGTVFCNRTFFKTNRGEYQNFLWNISIDRFRLSSHYVGSALLNSKKGKQIIKCLE